MTDDVRTLADAHVDVRDDVEPDEDVRDDVETDEVDGDADLFGEGASERDPERRGSRHGRTAQLEREGEVAADFLERLLDIADLDGDIDVDIEGDRAAVAIVDSEDGRVPRRLIGPDGKVLEALQELARMAVHASTGERSRLMLDVGGFRAERRRAVTAKAQEAIRDCRDSDEPVGMEPMTAFERKVVHDEVLAAGLRSESEGAEPDRHVVVLPAD
ncbi:MAG TPA: R3H domain-containing nucleic acid-binding protein [Dermatophilaceae bacterium]|nr:R3H domain-containing nucleic acid-binding protein [Dermatophilaceae bacterium]